MDYKKKYKEALERAKKELNACGSQDCDAARQIFRLFPELASEDEKIISTIRKALESKVEDLGNGVTRTECLAWLEKQGEQNSNYIRITQNIIDYINKHKEKFENDIPKLGDIWNVKEICTYPCVNNGKPVVEIENDKGAWMRLPLYIAYDISPKLTESEDERIRKEIKDVFYSLGEGKIPVSINFADIFDWLERQSEQKPKKVSLWKHWKDGIAGGSEGEQIFLIKNGNTYSISSCLGFECDYIELSELDKLLEKQGKTSPTFSNFLSIGKNEDKVEPKFKVGDWIVSKTSNLVYRVDSILYPQSKCYYLSHNGGIVLVSFTDEQNYRLWTIADAKDGDVLITENKNIFIFKSINDYTIYDYCGLYFERFTNSSGTVNGKAARQLPTNYVPATKEQRDH